MQKSKGKIVAEVRKARERYTERWGFDVRAIRCDLRTRQEQNGQHVVPTAPKQNRPSDSI